MEEDGRDSCALIPPEARNNVEAYNYYLQQLRRRLELHSMQVFGTRGHILTDYLTTLKRAPLTTQQVDLCALCSSHKCEYIDSGGDWIQCDVCKEWVHQQCDGIYNALLAEKIQYMCPRCRVIFCKPHPGIQHPQLLQDPLAAQLNEMNGDSRRKLVRDKRTTSGKRTSARRRTKGEDSESSAENVRPAHTEVSIQEEPQIVKKTDTFSFRMPVAEYYLRPPKDKETQGSGRRSKQGKEANMAPQVIDNYVNAAFNSLRINHSTPYTAVQDLYLSAQTTDPDLPSLPLERLKSTLISDIVHPSNFASLFLNCFYEFSRIEQVNQHMDAATAAASGGLTGQPGVSYNSANGSVIVNGSALGSAVNVVNAANGGIPGATLSVTGTNGNGAANPGNGNSKSDAARREEAVAGLLETLLPANQIFYTSLFPVLPMDYDLRIKVATTVFDNLLLSLERQRFRYLRMLIPVALNCLLVFQKATLQPGEKEPTWRLPTNIDAIIGEAVEKLQNYDIPNVDLSASNYLTWDKLLCRGSDIPICDSEVPLLLTKRQWYDLKMRGVPLFRNVGVVRAALLHAIVNANLGIIILDKALGRDLTDHLIHFGVDSGRAIITNYASNSSFDAMLEVGCVYETTTLRPSTNLATIQEALKDDENIMDWDVLETPASVVWALSFIGAEFQRFEESLTG